MEMQGGDMQFKSGERPENENMVMPEENIVNE